MADASPTTRATSLAWFPYDVEEWETRCDGLTFDEETALHRAVRKAWFDKAVPCTLVDTPSAWQRLLGDKWRKLSAFLRTHFVRDAANPGRVTCDWLCALYARQVGRYQAVSASGREGGKKSGETRRERSKDRSHGSSGGSTNASSQASSGARTDKRIETGGTPGSYEPGGTPPGDAVASAAPDGAAAPSPRTSAPRNGAGPHTDDAPDEDRYGPRSAPGDRPVSLAELARRYAGEAAPPAPAPTSEALPPAPLSDEDRADFAELAQRARAKREATARQAAAPDAGEPAPGDAPVTVPPEDAGAGRGGEPG